MNTVLVVEDNKTEKEIIASCLQTNGVSVLTAKNAEEAFEQIKNHQFDAIILDIVLPDRSGFEICREIKSEAQTSKIPVVMCSTKDGEMDKFWGMKQGADAYLAKPIDQDELLRTVQQLLA
ncbi:MAG: response regulator [Cyanobacteria bacterium P01_A01_bin.135]